MSEYLCKLGTGHPVQATVDKDEKLNLQGIGTALNQLDTFANKGYFPKPVTEVLKNLYIPIGKMIAKTTIESSFLRTGNYGNGYSLGSEEIEWKSQLCSEFDDM